MLLRTRSLAKHFGSTRAIDALDLELEPGAPIALIGPNGAGKTTLLSLLCGYIIPTAGTIEILGKAPGAAALHGLVAALPQDAQLDPKLSVGKQLRFFARLQGFESRDAMVEVQRVLELVQLSDNISSKPQELSHGMRKRVAIAQMLMGSPELALLDEPTAGLDPPNVRIIRDLITANAAKTTFIISSHNLDELEKICASVVFLSDGKLQNHLPIDQVDDDSNVLRIRLVDVPADEFMQAMQSLIGVKQIERRELGSYVIEFDASTAPHFDQSVLRLLAERGWRYRQLVLGQSLEDKLF